MAEDGRVAQGSGSAAPGARAKGIATRNVVLGAGLGVVAGFGAAQLLGLLGDTCGLSVILDANENCGEATLACLLGGGGGGAAGGGLGSGDGRGGGSGPGGQPGGGPQSPQEALNDPKFTSDRDAHARDWLRQTEGRPGEYFPPPQGPVKEYGDGLIEDFFEGVSDIITGEIGDRQDAAREAERQREIDEQAEQQYPDNP